MNAPKTDLIDRGATHRTIEWMTSLLARAGRLSKPDMAPILTHRHGAPAPAERTWYAYRDDGGDERGDGGWGKTEREAIDDLLVRESERSE